MYNRKGALFQPRFRRRIIEDKNHLINSIIYIHNNPVTHGFVNCNTEWVYTSFLNIIEKNKLSWFNANEVITLFDDIHNFKSCHVMKCELDEIEDFIQF